MSYQSDSEIENVVRGFESCETDKDQFKHRHHLVVAIWYVEKLGQEAALDQMRSSLLRFLDHHGVDKQKYSEPVTGFWISKVADRLNELGPGISLVEKCNRIVNSENFLNADFRG
jgi:hypothetical protein